VTGLTAELLVAAGIDPEEVMPSHKVSMSQDMSLQGRTIGGQTTQDADVSFVDVSGQHVLIEVASSLDRMRDKMGANGAAQRQRYGRLVEVNPDRVLAYASPSVAWHEFFVGDAGTSVAERLPELDDGWGLIINGHYASPLELTAVAREIRIAEPKVPGFWAALKASGLSYAAVSAKTGDALQKELQKFARR
jgi:hypothetical protein